MKGIYITIILSIFLSCSSSQKAIKETKCPKIYKNKFISVHNFQFSLLLNQKFT